MRASIWLVALGLTLAIIGGMVSIAEGTSATHFAPTIMVIAGALFIVGVLVEFFQIGTAVRKIAART